MQNYRILYTSLCAKGLVRAKNEDNLLLGDTYLSASSSELPLSTGSFVTSGKLRDRMCCTAVFDGVGGEAKGEVASHLSAKALQETLQKGLPTRQKHIFCRPDYRAISGDLCLAMNRKVLHYAGRHNISFMGSTVAGICFSDKGLLGFNVGDSRCYRIGRDGIQQVSKDHSVMEGISGKSSLTQCIGIPESEFAIQPDAFWERYSDGMRFLLCTDGVTGLLSDRLLQKILVKPSSDREKALEISEQVLKRGAPDNYSLILLQIRAERS